VRAAALRDARKRKLKSKAAAHGADPGAGSVLARTGATRSTETQDQYLNRGRMLVNRYRRENGLDAGMDAVHPVEFVNWLLSLKLELKASTWRFYRQAAIATLQGLPHDATETAVAMIDADVNEETGEKPRANPKSRRTSSLKAKRFPKAHYDTVRNWLRYFSKSTMSRVLIDWMVAGMATGLRPMEWRATDIEEREDPAAPQGRRIWLYVLNAKATNGRGNGAVRTLDLSALPDDVVAAIRRMSERGAEWLMSGRYDTMQSQAAQLLYLACEKSLTRVPGRPVYSLYSLRHQFIANAKSTLPNADISAMAGHNVTTTAASSYGKKRSAWEPSEIGGLPSPVPEEVLTVRQRLQFFEDRMKLREAAGLPQPKLQQPDDDDDEPVLGEEG
jgi:hypothetical protein